MIAFYGLFGYNSGMIPTFRTIFHYGFLSFLFFLPFQTMLLLREPFVGGVKWEYGVVAVYGIDLLLVCILFLISTSWLWSIKYKVLSIKYGEPEMILALFLLWAGVSVFWASDHALASYFFVKLLLAVGVFFLAKSWTNLDMKKVVFVLLVAGVLQSGIGIAQFLSQQSISSSILGMSAHDASVAGSSVLKIDAGRFLRAYGTFPHPNVLGGFLGAVLVMGIMYYVSSIKYERSWRCITEIVVILSGVLVIFLGLILTFSRVAWLGVLLGLIVTGFSVFLGESQWAQRRFLKILFALGMAGVVFGAVLHEQIFPRFDTATIEREGSVSERITSLRDAQKLITAHSLIGVGAGNFTAEIIRKGEKGLMGEMGNEGGRPVWSVQPAHNVFLLIWSELGIIGLALFFGFLVFSIFPILKSSIINHQSTILIVIIPSLFLDHWLWSSHFGLIFLFLLLGLASRRY